MTVRRCLYLTAAGVQPRVPGIDSAQQFDQQVIAVDCRQPPHCAVVRPVPV